MRTTHTLKGRAIDWRIDGRRPRLGPQEPVFLLHLGVTLADGSDSAIVSVAMVDDRHETPLLTIVVGGPVTSKCHGWQPNCAPRAASFRITTHPAHVRVELELDTAPCEPTEPPPPRPIF